MSSPLDANANPLNFSIQVINPTLPHDDYGPQLNLTVWSLSTLALGWLVLRMYLKLYRHRGLWWDDYVLIASWVVLICGNISITTAIRYGFGKHTWDIKLENTCSLLFVSSFAGFFMIVGAAWSKSAFGITLLRISDGWHKVGILFIIVSVNLVLGLSGLFTWIRCWPLERNWNGFVEGTCWPGHVILSYNVFTAAYSGVMDIVLALFPWHMLWGLSMNKKEKISALCAMSMGVFAGITSLVKIYAIEGSGNFDSIDTVPLVALAAAEISVTIIAASIPILRALARDKTAKSDQGPGSEDTMSRWTWQRASRDVAPSQSSVFPVHCP